MPYPVLGYGKRMFPHDIDHGYNTRSGKLVVHTVECFAASLLRGIIAEALAAHPTLKHRVQMFLLGSSTAPALVSVRNLEIEVPLDGLRSHGSVKRDPREEGRYESWHTTC